MMQFMAILARRRRRGSRRWPKKQLALENMKDALDNLWARVRRRRVAPIDFDCVTRLVFVCKGNICRSAYAERYSSKLGLMAMSRGLLTTPGFPADPVANRVALRRGVSLEGHLTVQWSGTEIRTGDLVLVMEPSQMRDIKSHVDEAGGQLSLLAVWAQARRRVIPDPFGLPESEFDKCFNLIESSVNSLRDRLSASKNVSA
jgi:protein-tyrosine phosphatase